VSFYKNFIPHGIGIECMSVIEMFLVFQKQISIIRRYEMEIKK